MIAYRILKDTPFHKAKEILIKDAFEAFYGKVNNNQHFNSFFEKIDIDTTGSNVTSFNGSMVTSGANIRIKHLRIRGFAFNPLMYCETSDNTRITFDIITNPKLDRYKNKVGTFNGF